MTAARKKTVRRILLSLYHYFCFFLLMAFLISCCMILFLSIMTDTMSITLTEEHIRTAAVVTFLNVVFLSLLCTVIDAVRRHFMVERPVAGIVSAAEQIAKGDYSVRIPPLRSLNRADGLDRIVDCYNKMAEELSGIETMQTDFIANVSHEMKTPLSVMQNYGTLLEAEDLSDEDRIRYAKAVSEASRRLSDLVSNILKLNRLENHQIFPVTETYELNEQLCECLLGFEQVWEDKHMEIDARLDRTVTVCADPELLSLVWNNLISNALKFTEPGGRVSVALDTDGDFAVVRVSDTGCGISAEVGRHIFEKFYQGDTSHATEGNGLGLSLVKRVVDIVEGEIAVESVPGRGTTFTVRIKRGSHGQGILDEAH